MADSNNMMKQKIDPRVLGALVTGQIVVGTLTVRDVSARPAEQIRGPKMLWKIWGGSNLLGAALYWLVGRRRTS